MSIPATLLICIGFMLSGCADDIDAPAAPQVSAGASKLESAEPRSKAEAPAKSVPAPEPSLYTETVCKIRDGRVLPITVAGNAYECLLPKMQYEKSGHRLAETYVSWSRLDSRPFLSKLHGNRYVAVFANDRALTTSSAAPDAPIISGVAMATPTFSLSEDGTLEPGPLFLLEKMPKGFNTKAGNWRYTIIGPEGDIIGVTKGQHNEEVDFCRDCDRRSADAIYLALLRGQAPGEIVKRGEQKSFDPSKEGIDPSAPILDPNAPLGSAGGALPSLPPPVLGSAPPLPSSAPVGSVGGPIVVPGTEGQPSFPGVLDPNAPTLDPSAPISPPIGGAPGPALDPTLPILDPTKPSPGQASAVLDPSATVLDPTKPILDPNAQPIGAAPPLDPSAPIALPPVISSPAPTLTPGPILAPTTNLLAPPDPTQPVLDPNVPLPDPSRPVEQAGPNPVLESAKGESEEPITEQSAVTESGITPQPFQNASGGGLSNPDAPITAQPQPTTPTPSAQTNIGTGGGSLLNPDAPISAQPQPSTSTPTPQTNLRAGGASLLNPDAPISAQPQPAAPARPSKPNLSGGSGSLLNPDVPITAQPLPSATSSKPTRSRGTALANKGQSTRNPKSRTASARPISTQLPNQGTAGDLQDPELPIQRQEISGYFR